MRLGDLLTSDDNFEDGLEEDDSDDISPASPSDRHKAPIAAKAQVRTQLDRALYNRKQRHTHGPAATGQPDIFKAVNHERHGDTLTDPYDSHEVNKTDPFKEGAEAAMDRFLNNGAERRQKGSRQITSMLKSLQSRISTAKGPRVIAEESSVEIEVDLEDASDD